MAEQSFDVCVVGAGVAGIACAQGLARQGFSVLLLDRLHPMPACLKAEKIGGEAVSSLLRLGFQAAIDAALTPLRDVAVYFGERRLGTTLLDLPEAGALYHVLVNGLRDHLDPRIDFRPGTKAVAFEQSADSVEVMVDDGTRRGPAGRCRLVVLATGDARQLLEGMGAIYEPQAPQQTFVSAFSLQGNLEDQGTPVDTQTFHRPIPGGPVAYATFFRLGDALRANIFCPGPVSESWQRDLKQRPLETLAERNSTLAEASRSWKVTSPVMIRKMQVFRMRPFAAPRIVALGDAAHTIDPSGGGGMSFALLEGELLLNVYAPRWLHENDCSPAAIEGFYTDQRRERAVRFYFARGQYIFALNHDSSLRGALRRMRFALDNSAASRRSARSATLPAATDPTWPRSTALLYEQ